MRSTHLNALIVLVGTAGLGLGVRFAALPLVRVALPSMADHMPTVAAVREEMNPDSLSTLVVARDPFRVTRRSSPVTYDPVRMAQPAVPPSPKPTLALVGIVWDAGEPTALVEGLPGVDGPRPLRPGDTVAGLRVRAIRADRVVITGLDTTWTLMVREPWR